MTKRNLFALAFVFTLAGLWAIELSNVTDYQPDPLKAFRYALYFFGSLVIAAAIVRSSNHG